MNAQFRRHAEIRRKLTRQFEDLLEGRSDNLGVVDECNVELDDKTMPQPDITLTTAAHGEGPVPFDSVRLVIEIADTTAGHNLGKKRDLYARYGLPEYWVVDVKGKRVVQFWAPRQGDYQENREIALGGTIEAVTIPDISISTNNL